MRHPGLFIVAAAIAVLVPPLAVAGVKGGRDHRKEQRELYEMKKQLEVEEREVDRFEALVDEMNSLHMPSRFSDFFKVNKDIRKAMNREYEQLQSRVEGEAPDAAEPSRQIQGATMAEGPAGDGEEDTPVSRLHRMKTVIVESDGLQRAIALGDMDFVPRYRHLVGDFLDLMREDVEASWQDVRRREAHWE